MTGILKAGLDGRESSRPLSADRAVRFLCWDNYLTAWNKLGFYGYGQKSLLYSHRGVLPGSGSCELEPE